MHRDMSAIFEPLKPRFTIVSGDISISMLAQSARVELPRKMMSSPEGGSNWSRNSNHLILVSHALG
jgi:hypothetical protein